MSEVLQADNQQERRLFWRSDNPTRPASAPSLVERPGMTRSEAANFTSDSERIKMRLFQAPGLEQSRCDGGTYPERTKTIVGSGLGR
jgi:hypothetical protein